MTTPEPLLPVPEDDALDAAASAVVDGVATPEEAAAVAAAPDGEARVAALRAVARAVRSPVGEQRPAAADAGLAAALATLDGELPGTGAESSPAAPAEVRRLPAAPPTSARGRGLPRWAAVAAALLLVLGVGAFAAAVLSSDGDRTDTFTAAGPEQDGGERSAANSLGGPGVQDSASAPAPGSPTTAAAQAFEQAPAPAAGGAAPPAAAGAAAPPALPPPPPVVNGGELGRVDEVEALAQRAAAALDNEPDRATAAGGAALPTDVQACVSAAPAASGEGLGALRYRAVGSFQGTPAVVLAYDRESGQPPRLLLVLARAGCSLLASTHF